MRRWKETDEIGNPLTDAEVEAKGFTVGPRGWYREEWEYRCRACKWFGASAVNVVECPLCGARIVTEDERDEHGSKTGKTIKMAALVVTSKIPAYLRRDEE